MNSTLSVKGQLDIKVHDAAGNLKHSVTVPNLVVSTGRNHLASLLANQSPTVMSHMAIGTGTNIAAVGDTTLQTQLTRVSLTSTSRTNNSVTYVATFGTGAGTDGLITEAGIFNAGTGGTMLCRSVFGVVTKTVDDTLTISWTVSIV